MILIGFSIGRVALGVLFVSLSLLVLIIAYRKLLAYLGKGTPSPKDYCVLYSVEQNPVAGEVEIYFTTNVEKQVAIEVYDKDMILLRALKEGLFTQGGHIVRFDSNDFINGDYFYGLRTDNQKTVKKMRIIN
jgi:hypothetical protein